MLGLNAVTPSSIKTPTTNMELCSFLLWCHRLLFKWSLLLHLSTGKTGNPSTFNQKLKHNVHQRPFTKCGKLQTPSHRSRSLRGTIHPHHVASIWTSYGYFWRRQPTRLVVWHYGGKTIQLSKWGGARWTWCISEDKLVGFLSLHAFVYDVSSTADIMRPVKDNWELLFFCAYIVLLFHS